MNLNLYAFTGDPETLLARWNDALAGFDKSDFLLHVAATTETGLTVLDVCPTEADFQGWINGDAWQHIKTRLGGDVVVTRLGEIQTALARDDAVEVVRGHAHSDH
jgi:hypothetical protein